MTDKANYDVAIIGGGFAGSILGTVLAKCGQKVIVVDASTHPRFAVGESSTPLADSILGRLGRQYGIAEFNQLSTYGSWKRNHAATACGLKRGFTYYLHRQGQAFIDDATHENSLMVAASASDRRGDTHWYRPDVDHFFWRLATKYGCETRQNTRVVGITLPEKQTVDHVHIRCEDGTVISARQIVDASGSAGITARLNNQPLRTLKTQTRSCFAHYRDVQPWRDVLDQLKVTTSDSPFHCDASAQHHLLGNQWLWLLRFDNGVTSVGLTSRLENAGTTNVVDRAAIQRSERGAISDNRPLIAPSRLGDSVQQESIRQAIESNPSLSAMFASANAVTEEFQVGRLQRFFDPLVHASCVMLPTSAATIDPLHSTGIAHTLFAVSRLSDALLCTDIDDKNRRLINAVFAWYTEIEFLDDLISTAYDVIEDFPRFAAACMVYFVAVIACEEKYQSGAQVDAFFGTDDAALIVAAEECCQILRDERSSQTALETVARRLAPWNTAGLFCPHSHNRYAYTATK